MHREPLGRRRNPLGDLSQAIDWNRRVDLEDGIVPPSRYRSQYDGSLRKTGIFLAARPSSCARVETIDDLLLERLAIAPAEAPIRSAYACHSIGVFSIER